MTAKVIDLLGRRRTEAQAADIAASLMAYEKAVNLARAPDRAPDIVPRPKIAPDDPIFALFDAYKEAKARYDAAFSEMARRCGQEKMSMAALLRSVRQHHKAKVRADLHDLPEGVLPI